MLTTVTVAQAALENARWCDLVCGASGAPGELHDVYWIDWHPVPPLYPRLVTLSGKASTDVHLAAVRALLARAPGGSLAVKDSFAALDLTPLGFRRLFEAEWIAAGPPGAVLDVGAGVRLSLAHDADALARWEVAWRGAPPAPGLANVRLFPPALLGRPGVDFVACERDGALVATCALHAADGVVGVSNLGGDEDVAIRGAMAMARERYPGVPLVGYESGASLDVACAAGFTRLGPLAVWQRSAS